MISDLFKTTTLDTRPLDGSLRGAVAGANLTSVSDFLTVQSLANFAAMTGAIGAAWKGLQRLDGWFSTLWIPYGFAAAFGLVSIVISAEGLRKTGTQKLDGGKVMAAIFVAVINALVLASAVVGTGIVEPGPTPGTGPVP